MRRRLLLATTGKEGVLAQRPAVTKAAAVGLGPAGPRHAPVQWLKDTDREADVRPCMTLHGAIRARSVAAPLPLLLAAVGVAACWQRTIAHPWVEIQLRSILRRVITRACLHAYREFFAAE